MSFKSYLMNTDDAQAVTMIQAGDVMCGMGVARTCEIVEKYIEFRAELGDGIIKEPVKAAQGVLYALANKGVFLHVDRGWWKLDRKNTITEYVLNLED